MRKSTLLTSLAMVSLLGATAVTSAQSVNQGSPKGTEPPAAAAPKGERPPASPSASKPAQTQTETPAAPGAKPSPTAQDRKGAPQRAQDRPASTTQPKSATTPADGSKGTATSDSAAAAAPPEEKRGQIATAIKQEKIPAVTNVNFNISIGTRVPSTVRFHPLPSRIVEIYPQWRGYRVIYVNGRYVIVHPKTYEIVYIIVG
jgi:hypothetical protein